MLVLLIGSIPGKPDAGITLGFPVDEKSQVEVLYVFARPQARFDSTNAFYASTPWFDVTTQYLQLGGTVDFSATERLVPFFGGGLGLAWFSPSGVEVQGAPSLQPADTWLAVNAPRARSPRRSTAAPKSSLSMGTSS